MTVLLLPFAPAVLWWKCAVLCVIGAGAKTSGLGLGVLQANKVLRIGKPRREDRPAAAVALEAEIWRDQPQLLQTGVHPLSRRFDAMLLMDNCDRLGTWGLPHCWCPAASGVPLPGQIACHCARTAIQILRSFVTVMGTSAAALLVQIRWGVLLHSSTP